MLEFLRSLVVNEGVQHTQSNQGNQGNQINQDIQKNQVNQHFKTGNHCWFKGSSEQSKNQT
jgi:hypothetical protein